MLRKIIRTGFTTSFIIPGNVFDKTTKQTNTEMNIDLTKIREESGWVRLKKIFEIDDLGNVSKEILTIMNVAAMSSLVGCIYGGFVQSRLAYMDFIRNNQATSFPSHIEAKRKLQEVVTISFGKGAWKWGWRLTFFCTTFISFTTFISVYRGKPGLLEYVLGGFIAGSSYKFNMGPRGWIVGGGLGSVLGLIGGGLTVGLAHLTGVSLEDARYWQYQVEQQRQSLIRKGLQKHLEEEEGELLQNHNKEVAGKNTEEVLAKIAAIDSKKE